MSVKYDEPTSCNKCGGNNICTIKDSIERTPLEYNTVCSVCGFHDYWVTGFFESRLDGYNSSEKYEV
jgi:hypothetical protein